MRTLAAAALGALLLSAATAAAEPAPRLVSARVAVIAKPLAIVVSAAATAPTLTLRQGTAAKTVRTARVGAGRWHATVVLPLAGAWTVSARVGAKHYALGVVTVRFAVGNAVRIAAGAGGTLLVADSAGQRIVRLDPARGTESVVASGLARLTSVTEAADGTIFATANEKVWRLSGGRTEVDAGVGDPPLDIAAAGSDLYVSRYGPHVDRLSDGRRTRYSGFDRPHGVTAADERGAYVADSYAGAVRRISAGGAVSTIASDLQLPVDVAVASGGSLLVADVGARSLFRIDGGRSKAVALNIGSLTGVVLVNGKVYVSAIDSGFSVGRVDLASGRLTVIA
jgi:sugar lactone lactonase YvrE